MTTQRRSAGCDTDWIHFQDLTAQAETASGPERINLLGRAVSLVRGHPFADGCSWAERDGLASLIEDDTMAAIRTLADLQLRAGDAPAAVATVGIGLGLQPNDETLALTGVDAAHTAGRLNNFYDNLAGRLDANGDTVAPSVTARYQYLRRQPPPSG